MDRFDEAIDKEVRRLMAAEPPPDLRARVLAQLDVPSRPPAMRWWLAAAGAAAIVVLAAVLTLRPSAPPEGGAEPTIQSASRGGTATSAPAVPPPISPAPVNPSSQPAGRASRRLALPVPPVPDDRIVQATSTDATADAVPIAPLEGVTPLAIDPVRSRDLDMSDIAVPLLEMQPVRVDPISSTPR